MYEVGQNFLQQGHDVVFYEDFPYTIRENKFQERLAELPTFQSVSIPISHSHLIAKIEAFGYYRSQIPMLFKHFDKVPSVFTDFARSIGGNGRSLAERLWIDSNFSNPIGE